MYIVIRKDKEVFKLSTYPGIKKDMYSISNYGSIRNNVTNEIFFPTSRNSAGYVHTSLCTESFKVYTSVLVSRLVAWEFCDGYDKELNRVEVNHKDINRANNYYENLEWVTRGENTKFAYVHGNRKVIVPDSRGPRAKIRGSLNPKNVFSEEFVHELCQLFTDGKSTKEILKIFNTSKKLNTQLYSLLMTLKHRKGWGHITEKYVY